MKITVWNIKKDNGTTVHNHIENGWVDGGYPKPIKDEFTNQKAWENMNWDKKYANLINGKIIY
ncbi:hypothetical protein [Metabacillus fastidiosus]|uniref:hypothetical protein n=1 Tax=Metabacillus fastidiosus TaxID=1458 RepID=UPI003D2E078E